MKIALVNALALSMVGEGTFEIRSEVDPAGLILEGWLVVNAIGHESTDNVVRALLAAGGALVPQGKRVSVSIGEEIDMLLVAQYVGPRLPEGATTLPEGAHIEFFTVCRTGT